jgi:hypothetical protein
MERENGTRSVFGPECGELLSNSLWKSDLGRENWALVRSCENAQEF